MRGIGHTLSRLPNATAGLAAVLILTGAFASTALGQTSGLGNGTGTRTGDALRASEVAWAVPRMQHGSTSGVMIPQPLGAGDAADLQLIFAAQTRGDTKAAINAASALQDPLLLGTVLADCYLGRGYRAAVAELSEWLARYPDLPDAPAIRALLATRLPKGAALPDIPEARVPARSSNLDSDAEETDAPRGDLARQPVLDRNVLGRAEDGDAAGALRLINAARRISLAYAGQLRAEVAQVLFTRNENVLALGIAETALKAAAPGRKAARDQPSLSLYIGGLAAWRLGRVELARDMFAAATDAVRTTKRLHAAAAFWTARTSRALHNEVDAVKFLRVAAEERLTLHGRLARHLLRLDAGSMPSRELASANVLGQADVDAVAATAGGRRAFALLQIGQRDRAEAELRRLWAGGDDPVFARSLLMVTAAAGFSDCTTAMAASLMADARTPMPRLHPAGGFSVDPALVYAVTRIESNFNPGAVSPAGALGLMQIMPSTAQYITGDVFFTPRRLHEPAANLDIGQRYIAYLAKQGGIDNDLMRLLASYNAGPGNFARWGADMHDQGDPLLFIEAIPAAETRAFVPHALMYSWIYAARMQLPAESLDSLAAGEFPRFTPRGQESRMALSASGPN